MADVTAMTEGTQPDTPQVTATNEGAAPSQAAPAAPAPTSRLGAILQSVAKVASVGMQGIPESRRPSFATGLGEGARAQQAIKFKSFDDQVRLAQLHNQDLKMQQDTEAQKDAHIKAELDNRSLANSLGIKYDTIASDGKTVMDHLTAQTAGTGSASVPPGTHLTGDGSGVNIPQNDKETQDGQKQMYSMLGPALGLPPLPPSADFVPPQLMNMLSNKIHGYGLDGKPINHQDLPGAIGALEAQRDQLKKNGANEKQLQAVDNMLGIYKANLDSLDKHDADLKAKNKQAELDTENSDTNVKAAANKAAKVEQAKLDVTNSPANQAAAARGKGQATAAETEAKNKVSGQMFSGTDKNGNQVAGTSDELQAAGVANPTKLDADTGKKVTTARQLISPEGLFAQIRQDMDNLDKKGKLGSAATARFNDAMLKKAGSDADYAPLFVHTHLLATALMQAHVGSKGSTDMMEEFKALANSGKMSSSTLRAALGAEYNYVHEKAMLPKKASK